MQLLFLFPAFYLLKVQRIFVVLYQSRYICAVLEYRHRRNDYREHEYRRVAEHRLENIDYRVGRRRAYRADRATETAQQVL